MLAPTGSRFAAEGQPLLRLNSPHASCAASNFDATDAERADADAGGADDGGKGRRPAADAMMSSADASSVLGGGIGALGVALLVLVCTQNAAYSLVRRYSMGIQHTAASDSSVLATQEVLKLLVAARMMLREPAFGAAAAEAGSSLRAVGAHSLRMIVPAVTFVAMNVLGFVALRNMSAAAFAVLQQLKILTTAVLSRALLGRRLSWTKWRALLLLLAGVVLLTHEEHAQRARAAPERARAGAGWPVDGGADESLERGQGSLPLGVCSVLLETILSGFATVYFERVVKSSALSIWQRNVQLALWSLCIFGPLALRDAARAGASPFAGWRALDVLTALLGSAGGLLVALVIARFDSIVKSIAVAMSIVVTGLASAALLGAQLTLPFALASSVVVIATVNYTFGQ